MRIVDPDKNATKCTETTKVTYATSGAKTEIAQARNQTTFYTDLKTYGSFLLKRKVKVALYTFFFLLCIFVFIWSLYNQALALRERDMWLRANDISRRSTIYIRYANSEKVRVGWLWEERLMILEKEPFGLAAKYSRYGAEM